MPEWDVNAERQLLFAVLKYKETTVSRKDWDGIAEIMNLGYSGNACRYGVVT
jgi:hypothetical protein